jgi:hypothetical protein
MKKSDTYLQQYDVALRCKYSSEATRKNYYTAASKFLIWASGKGELVACF